MKLFQTLPALLSVTSATCYDNNNFGCSHTCTNSVCTCPPCWELGDDQKTCKFADGKATVTCSTDGATITINKCAVEGVAQNEIHLKDSTCAATDETDSWKISTGFDNCGTEFAYAAEKLTLQNTLSIGNSVVGGRVVSRKYDIDFTCNYNNLAEASSTIKASNNVFLGITFNINDGQPADVPFDFGLDFYESDAFSTVLDLTTGVFTPGVYLFGSIAPTTALAAPLEFSVGKCTVEDKTVSQNLAILDTCPVDEVDFSFKDSQSAGIQSAVMFSYQSFVFPTSADDTTIDVTCDVNVCLVGDADCLKKCCTMSEDATIVEISVTTATQEEQPSADNDSAIYFRFVKQGCTYDWIEIDIANYDDRVYGNTDVHRYLTWSYSSDECLLDIEQIQFKEEADDGWYCTQVRVEVNVAGSCTNEVTLFEPDFWVDLETVTRDRTSRVTNNLWL